MASSAFDAAVVSVQQGGDAEELARQLHKDLTDVERLGLLDGDAEFWPGIISFYRDGYNVEPIIAGQVPRLGIPGIRFSDGPRGAVVGHSTCFPVAMARAATWDIGLEERVGDAIGREIRAQGGNFFGGVCINLLRHPAWGRAQETYGEDPVLLGEMGAALTRGAQRHVMACVKHYACNSMENARFTVDVQIAPDVLREVYLQHFERVIREGVAAVMSAYNSVNGSWCGQSRELLSDILRDEWQFRGFVVSDFLYGLRDPVQSLLAGLDVEMPFRQQRAAVMNEASFEDREVRQAAERSCVRVIATQIRFAAMTAGSQAAPSDVSSEEHRALAREASARSMVLLRNRDVGDRQALPLDASCLTTLALVGRLAAVPNTGDHGSSDVRAPYVVTPLEGIRRALPDVAVIHDDASDPAATVATCASVDVAVVVVGYTAEEEGEFVDDEQELAHELFPPASNSDLETFSDARGRGALGHGGDRASLRLKPEDEQLIRRVTEANPYTVVVVVAGSAVLTGPWDEDVAALVIGWYSGMEGGNALADVLLGEAEPSGRLPFVIPQRAEDLPEFLRDATRVTYDRNFGYRKLAADGAAPAYPFGFGLGYTRFRLEHATASMNGAALAVGVTVTNVGERRGTHVIQVYGSPDRDGSARAELLGFTTVCLHPGESRRVQADASLRPLATWDVAGRSWRPFRGRLRLAVGAHHGDDESLDLAVDC